MADTCTVCGKFKDIWAKIFSDYNILFCKQCYDNELDRLKENFDQIKFNCIRCGSSNVTRDESRAGINEDVGEVNSLTKLTAGLHITARLTCNDCKSVFYTNILEDIRNIGREYPTK